MKSLQRRSDNVDEPENLAVLADMTVRLLELRQNECKHLVVEDSAPILFGKLVGSYLDALAKEVPTRQRW
ncbi:hypothetical protein [Pseudomonas aeruginosa]|uniref:hypothetical protein n=1 Tax=Pseudomonas aeruginosa TaxID=287 RepID=UPI0019D199C9|nr:hypothetical protein [Pseudomonas aeruginosa]